MTSTTPYFIAEANKRYSPRKNLEGEVRTDILVVGGGIAGLSAANKLTQVTPRSTKITVVEADRLGHATTGKSSGLLVDSIEDDFVDSDPAVCDQLNKGLEGIITATTENNLACDLRKTPSLYLARKEEHIGVVVREYEARKAADFPVQLLNNYGHILERATIGHTFAAMLNEEGYCIDGLAFTQELGRILDPRVRIYERTPIIQVNRSKKTAKTPQGTIHYGSVVFTNGAGAIDLDLLKHKVFFLETAVAVTRPLTEEEFQKTWKRGEHMLWDSEDLGYVYARPVGDKRILIGGSDRLNSLAKVREGKSNIKQPEKELKSLFNSLFPHLAEEVAFSHLWTGVIPAPIDGLSFVGEISPQHFVALYNAGLPNAFRSGELVAEMVATGKEPEDFDLFRWNRDISFREKSRVLTKWEPVTSLANYFFFRK
ncbi:MAG TPA: FAD-dependent oxidoreductase [Candidatus Nanoarchaeia archaeon]|nr:FAD-dependent oxidoreductase [Candidatus Nanoarchaeia archaeon]